MTPFTPHRFGWHRDTPDPRDFLPTSEPARELLGRLAAARSARAARPARVDWGEYLPSAEDQRDRASCSALACVALAGYFERRSSGRSLDASAWFLYQTARRLLHWEGDSGAKLRAALKAMVRFGLPPEEFCRYDPTRIDAPADPLLYAYADRFSSVRYVRLDPSGATGAETLAAVKAFLASGFACVFGFTAFDSLTRDPDIPSPTALDTPRGGQAVVAVGYDDARRHRSSKGALLVRATWGEGWGEGGTGWLPYAYVERQLAADFWTLLEPRWLDSGEFTRPRLGP